jgi:hypothetical protein
LPKFAATEDGVWGECVNGPNNSKTSVAFWKEKVYKPKRKNVRGDEVISDHFYANFYHEGKTTRLCLGTADRTEAARKAQDAYLLLKSKGRNAMLEVYKTKTSIDRLRDLFLCEILPAFGISLEDPPDTSKQPTDGGTHRTKY